MTLFDGGAGSVAAVRDEIAPMDKHKVATIGLFCKDCVKFISRLVAIGVIFVTRTHYICT